MRFLTALPLGLAAAPLHAHAGHLGDLAGHDHWVAGAAVDIAIGLAAWGALKGRKDEPSEAEPEAEEQPS